MATRWFSAPVYAKTDRPGVTYGCNNVEGAAEELMKWTKMGPKWREAVQLCIDAGEDRATPEEARKYEHHAARRIGAGKRSVLEPSGMWCSIPGSMPVRLMRSQLSGEKLRCHAGLCCRTTFHSCQISTMTTASNTVRTSRPNE
ncbi:DUF982 domain-containing protein [Mesorhizobium sp. M0207]|uniref:DUF982 domain-containing protein n=3 Tax=unclassified Mesorhizobium TaxID=325217 RepID=UPI0033398399